MVIRVRDFFFLVEFAVRQMIKTNIHRNDTDPSQFTIPSTLNPGPTNISIKPEFEGIDEQASIIQDIQRVTAGDGEIRSVSINNVRVPREYVEDAMFSNQQVMPRTDQFPIEAKPITLVTSLSRQRSMFGKMPKSPFGLAFDVIGNSDDDRITITNTGGRFYKE